MPSEASRSAAAAPPSCCWQQASPLKLPPCCGRASQGMACTMQCRPQGRISLPSSHPATHLALNLPLRALHLGHAAAGHLGAALVLLCGGQGSQGQAWGGVEVRQGREQQNGSAEGRPPARQFPAAEKQRRAAAAAARRRRQPLPRPAAHPAGPTWWWVRAAWSGWGWLESLQGRRGRWGRRLRPSGSLLRLLHTTSAPAGWWEHSGRRKGLEEERRWRAPER